MIAFPSRGCDDAGCHAFGGHHRREAFTSLPSMTARVVAISSSRAGPHRWVPVSGALTVLVLVLVLVLVASGCGSGPSSKSDDGEPALRAIPTVLVVDSSASMAEDDAPGARMDAAKTSARHLVDAMPDGADLTLVAYGANSGNAPGDREESCSDVSLFSSSEKDDVRAAVDGLSPGGYTPIGRALRVAVSELNPATEGAIVLLSDGEDTCGDPSPCEAAEEISRSHPGVTVSPVGFKVADDELACVARVTGGVNLTADDVDELVLRLVVAQNPDQAADAMTTTGIAGVELGQHYDAIRSITPDFPGQSTGASEGGNTVIRWIDCDWIFDPGGVLVEIRRTAGATVDGVAVGDPIAEVREVYRDAVSAEPAASGDGAVELYTASRAAGTAWKISSDAAGRVTAIGLCRCLPGTGDATGRSGGGGARDLPAGLPAWARESGTTKVEILRPVDAAGRLQPGFTAEPSDQEPCDASGRFADDAANAAVEPGTVQCTTTTAAAATECWPDETGAHALCMGTDMYVLREIPSARRLTGQPLNPEWPAVPLYATTRDGDLCRYRFGGGNSAVEHGGTTYVTRVGCEGGLILLDSEDGVFFRSGEGITAMATRDIESVFPVQLETVYFLGTA